MDEPFALRNTPIYLKPAKVKPPPEKQLALFRGLGDSPGQRDFVEESADSDLPASEPSE